MPGASKASFVYVTYIQTTPEKVWNALQDPEMTKDYWGRHRNRSDWQKGSAWSHEDYDDENAVRVVGTVVESDKPRRLVLTWAHPNDAADPEQVSRVTFDIEEAFGAVRLTVTHEDLSGEMLRAVSGGWPAVLSSLKTLLETGASMPMTRQKWHR
jgi:uncharacterized protein YndB with AHSA1/START domain